eukprot:gene3858-2736_t
MGYGGPRFAFHIQPDYDNYADNIKKETSYRIQAHYDAIQRKEDAKERDRQAMLFHQREMDEQRRLAEEKAEYRAILEARKEEEERRRTGKTEKKMCPADKAAWEFHKRRIKALAIPKQNPQPAYGGMMYGRCMHQSSRYVEFPKGRWGQPYTPGIDRDRIIPKRPNPKDLPPWIGSYSSHKSILSEPMLRKNAEEEEDYYCGDFPHRSGEAKKARRAHIDAMLRRMDEDEAAAAVAQTTATAPQTSSFLPQFSDLAPAADSRANVYDDDEDTPSIFSHADSNGPIVATGAQHLAYNSTREEVDTHLRKYGGAMTAPKPEYNPDVWVKDMNLPQLQEHLFRLQHRPKKVYCG